MRKFYSAISRSLSEINITYNRLAKAFSILLILAFTQQSFAQTNTWDGSSFNGNWSTTSNWSLNHIPTAAEDVVIPNVSRDPIINVNAICKSLTINSGGNLTSGGFNLDVNGSWTNNGTFNRGTGTVTFKSATNNTIAGSSTTTFYNLIINKTGAANTITSTTNAFQVANNLTVTQGNLILQATNADYGVTGDINVSANGTLTHSVNWDTYGRSIKVSGSIAIDGLFTYTTRSTVWMVGTGSETVRTGANASSAFSIFLLNNGNFSANGALKINDNFWPMFGSAGSFHTNNQTVTANAGVLINGGTVFIDGGTLNVTGGGVQVGAGTAGIVNFSAGTLNTDGISIGAPTAGTFTHSGGTANINGDLNITGTGTYTATNSPIINISGNWINDGTFTAATNQVNFTGTTPQTIGGNKFTTFNNLNIANTAGVSLATATTGSTNVNNILNFTNGLITTGANTITVAAAGNITGYGAGKYVNGRLSRVFSGVGSKPFPIGKGGNYRPVTFAYSSLTGTNTVTVEQFESSLTGTLPGNTILYPDRYWDISQSGGSNLNYKVTLDGTGYTPGGPVQILKKESGNISASPSTTPNYTNSTGFTTLTGTNSFALGHNCSLAVPSGTNNSRCGTGTVVLNATPSAGETIDWYAGPAGGTALLTGNTSFTTPSLSTTTIYYAESRNTTTGCKSSTRTAVTATVNITPVPTGTSPQPFCATDNPTIGNLTASGTAIQWYDAPTGGTLYVNSDPLITNTHYYASQTIAGCESATRLNILVVVNPAVVIGTQPNPSQTICVSSQAVFSVSASNGMGYQWYKGTTALTDGDNITGSQTATLRIPETDLSDAGIYHVVITGRTSCADAISADAELIINDNLLITDQPDAQILCVGENASFIVVSGGTDLTYKWRKGSVFIDAVGNPSAATSTLTLPNITAADAGSYSVLVSDGAGTGCTERYSLGAALTVNATSVGGTVNGSIAKCSGTNSGSLTLTGKTGNVLNWEFSEDNGATWTIIANTNTTQAYSNLITTTLYRAVVKNGVCDPVYSSIGTITVNPIPDAIATPTSQTICSGSALTTIGITGSVSGTTFNWVRTPVAGITGIATTGSGDISGTLTNTTAAPITVTFTITPTALTCVGTPVTATVLVNPTPVLTVTPAAQTKCSGVAITTIALTSTTTGTAFAWTRDNTTGVTGIAANGTGNISGTLTNTTAAPITVTFTITPTANGCDGTAKTATVLVNPTPDVTATPASQTICSATAMTPIALSGSTTGTTYTWTRNNTVGVTGIAATGSGSTISGTLTNTTSAPITVTFTITPTATSCAGIPITATVLVNPSPLVVRSQPSQTICSESNILPITLSSLTTGSTFSWTRNNTAGVTGIAASGTGDISGSLTNTTFAAITVTFTINAAANGCTGSSNTATVVVNPTPNVIVSNSNQTRCSGVAIATMALTTSVGTGTTYAWTRDNTGTVTGINASGTGNISGTLNNTTAVPVTVTFTITPTKNGCPGTPSTATVLVNPKPTAGAITGAKTTVCIGDNLNLTPAGAGIGALNYSWSSSNITTATVNSSGVVLGKAAGTTNITYTVTDANGCTSATSANYLVTVTKPTAGAITGAKTSICMNETLALVSHGSGVGTLGVAWLSSNSGIASVDPLTGVVAGVSAGTANITYTVTDGNGCTTTSGIYTVTIVQIPTGTFTATETSGTANNDNIICNGSTVKFTAPAGYGSYIFKVGGTSVQTGTSNVYNASTLTDGASVTVEVANSLNCGTTFGPIIINVIPLPTPTLVATENSGTPDNNSICAGENVTFTATGGTTYTFKINGSSITTNTTGIYSTTNLNNGDVVTVDVTNANNCTATSAPVTINVSAIPSGTLVPSSNNICVGESVTFTATGGTSYRFLVDGAEAQAFSSAATFSTTTLVDGQIVTVEVSNAAGCTVTYSPGVAVNVNPLPTGTLAATENSGVLNDNNICANAPVTFTFSATGYSTYEFFINNVSKQSGGSNSFITTALAAGDVVTVQVTSGSSCLATFNAPAITIAPSPVASLSVSPSNAICAGDEVTFTADPGTGNTYNFKIGANSVQNGNGNTYTTTTLTNGDVVTVEVTNTNSCVTISEAITMVVSPLPTGTLVAVENAGTPDDDIICTGTNVVFTAPAGFTTYNFILNGVSKQISASNTYTNSTLATGDKVQVALTNAGGCIGLSNEITITVNPLPTVAAITGTMSVCLNSTTALSDVTAGGIWSSLNTGIATIDAVGVVTGVAAGTATINYTFTNTNGCTNTVSATITVNALPNVAAITGNFNICTGFNSLLSNSTTDGGTWTWGSSNPLVAGVDPGGLVVGNIAGSTIISYTFTETATGCSSTVTETVVVTDEPEVAPITTTAPSGFNVCISGSLALKDITSGGTWKSSDTDVAKVNASSGVVTGVSAGTVDITYSITTSCGQDATATQTITVNAAPSATISYAGGPVCAGSGPIAVTQTGTTGGTYSASGGLIIDPVSGTITPGTTGGSFTITYSVPAAGGCAIYTTTASVVITPAPAATIAYGGPYCTSSAPVNVSRTGTPGGTYSSSAGLTLNASTGAITPATSTNGTYTVTYTVAAAGGCAVFTTDAQVTITSAPTATIAYAASYCTSSASATVTRTGTAGGTYSYTGGPGVLVIDPNSGTITPAGSTGGTYTVKYSIAASGGCAAVNTTTSVIITDAPTAIAGTAPVLTCANTGAVNITAGSSATNYSSVLWSGNGTFTNANSLTLATYTPTAAEIAAGTATIALTANGNGSCGAAISTSTKTITINGLPESFTVTPATATICQGDIVTLIAAGDIPTTGTQTISSGPITVNIPDAVRTCVFWFLCSTDPGSVTTNMSVNLPAGAKITDMSVNFNIDHTNDADLVLNLRAPNGNVLNLVRQGRGGSGDNFHNTTVSSTSNNNFDDSRFSPPFTGTYEEDASNNVGTPQSDNIGFPGLYSVPNGTWTFGAEDRGEGNVGKITSWSLTFNYTVPVSPQAVVWSPSTDLYTDAGATVAYTGTPESVVYAKPASAGTKNYTATSTNGNQCSIAQNASIIVNPAPVVKVTADYCAIPGKVLLTATSIPAATSYSWSTGSHFDTTQVNVAGDYDVTAFLSSGCPGKGKISVANELVTNGNFEAGNTGFITPPLGGNKYTYQPDIAGNDELHDEGLYGIGPDANTYKDDWHGHDHTTGSGNFMIINGFPNGNPQPIVWQDTVNVLPNTTYYFSAWGMSMNSAGNYARLQFNVNGDQVGSAVTLLPRNTTDNWQKFYGTLTTGPTTTIAVISITDLQNERGGNDFGLDDISFSTLSTFVNLESAPGTDAQTPCVNTAIEPIVYSVGSSASAPIVAGLPTGVTSSFNGVLLTIIGTPTVAGNYSYSVTTTGSCQPSTATGTINVQAQKITLSSGSATQSLCINTPVSIGYTLSGTADNATVTGLPGATTTLVGKVFTINWTPTTPGPVSFSVTTSGTCTPVTVTGTITVTQQTIALSSAAATDGQTVCINSPITTIKYTVGGTGTGANIVWTPGIPAGITSSYASGIFQVTGTPTVSGSFSYVVTTTGGCAGVTASGTLNITPAASMTLTSGTGSDAQTSCNAESITPITYAINDATGASITSGAFPAGVIGAYSAGTPGNPGTYTISGTPTVGGVFSYTIKTSGGCATASMSGTITVTAQAIALTSGAASPSVCANVPIPTNIVYTISGAATGASISGQPNGISGVLSGNTFTISGTPTDPPGDYDYTVTTSGTLCTPATLGGRITISQPAVGGTLTSVSTCSGVSGTLTLTGNSNNPKRWEYSDNGGTTWAPVANTTISLTYPGITSGRQYRAVVGNNCGDVYSSVALVGIHNLWTGATGTDWNVASNWSDNQLPSSSCADVYIPNVPNQPTLSSAVTTINNLHIAVGAVVTISNATIRIAGTIDNQGTLNAKDGTIELNGTTAQTITTGTALPVKDLMISNTNATGITLAGPVDVYHELDFAANGKTLNSAGNLTIKSTATETAWIGDLTDHTINGDVTVERYINTAGHGKAWEFLAIPTQGQTVLQSWMENGNLNSTGYGTQVIDKTGPSNGFDITIPQTPSMKYYDPTVAGGWKGIDNTGIPIYDAKGYMVFVRGDRSVDGVINKTANETTLRTTGALIKGPLTINVAPVGTSIFASVGNPFASAIDMTKVVPATGPVDEFFSVWDPYAYGSYGVGTYKTYSKNPSGDYEITPGGGELNNLIQSGQAFFVQMSGGLPGNIIFTEPAKAASSNLTFFRPQGTSGRVAQLRTNLYSVAANGTKTLADGTLQQFSDDYRNEIDGKDARKILNGSENLSIRTEGKNLIVERRQTLNEQDTIFYTLTNLKAQKYQFEFTASNISGSGLEGFVEDTYLNARIPLSLEGKTELNYAVTSDKASSATGRFRIVFKTAVVLPVTFVSVNAYEKNGDIAVEWKVENEANMQQYEVEKSTDGSRFTKMATIAAGNTGAASYNWLDQKATPGYNYYRIRSTDLKGKVMYSDIVKVLIQLVTPEINIYPNPITNGIINLHLINQPAGTYNIRLLNPLGQTIVSKQVTRADGTTTEHIQWNYNLAHGTYQLQVTKPNGELKVIKVMY